MAGNKTILTVAVTGNLTTLAQHLGLPCTPQQIATAALESAKAGARIAHFLVRYPDGRPSVEPAQSHGATDRIRDKNRASFGIGRIEFPAVALNHWLAAISAPALKTTFTEKGHIGARQRNAG
jgi:uncharacterized protein (DUF849 family)